MALTIAQPPSLPALVQKLPEAFKTMAAAFGPGGPGVSGLPAGPGGPAASGLPSGPAATPAPAARRGSLCGPRRRPGQLRQPPVPPRRLARDRKRLRRRSRLCFSITLPNDFCRERPPWRSGGESTSVPLSGTPQRAFPTVWCVPAMQRVDSIDDPRVAPYRNLRDRTLRGESIFVTEGSDPHAAAAGEPLRGRIGTGRRGILPRSCAAGG